MAARYLRIKKVTLNFLTVLLLVASITGTIPMTSAEAVDVMNEYGREVILETADQRQPVIKDEDIEFDFDDMEDDNFVIGIDRTVSKVQYMSANKQEVQNEITVTIDGSPVQWTDAVPFIDNNSRTMVPLRAVAEALGLTVTWDNNKKEAIFTDGKETIYFGIGKGVAKTSTGMNLYMTTEPIIKNSRTYAPIRYLAEFFGYKVEWNNEEKRVEISHYPADYNGPRPITGAEIVAYAPPQNQSSNNSEPIGRNPDDYDSGIVYDPSTGQVAEDNLTGLFLGG